MKAFSLLAILFHVAAIGCKSTSGSGTSDISSDQKTVSLSELEIGDKFRISPQDQVSKCYLPGKYELVTGNCGDQSYWIIVAAERLAAKQVKSLISGQCLQFHESGKLGTAPCAQKVPTFRMTKKPPCEFKGRSYVVTDQCEVPGPVGDQEPSLSAYEKQMLLDEGGSLTEAYRKICEFKGEGRLPQKICTIKLGGGKPTVMSPSLVFTMSSPSPNDQLIYRSDLKMSRKEESTASFASEIRWGHVPRIKAIAVAVQGSPLATENGHWISGIQIFYATGEKVLIGSCRMNERGDCEVNNKDHPDYPNPIYFDSDEYITGLGMKFGPVDVARVVRHLPQSANTRLIEIMLKTNKTGKKPNLWKGRSDNALPWSWLQTKSGDVIAGFFGTNTSLEVSPPRVCMPYCEDYQSTLIQSMGVIYATIDAYKAHNPEAFPKDFGKKTPSHSLSEKDGTNMIGATSQSAEFLSSMLDFNIHTGIPGPKGLEGKAAIDKIFRDPSAQFSSTFYGGNMGNAARTSSVRAYFKKSILVALVVHPKNAEGLVSPEIYGEIPNGETPNLYLELQDGEHISELQWKTGIDGAGKIDSTFRAARFKGPTINGLLIKTNKGRQASYSAPEVASKSWMPGLGRHGYAIVGFHGVSIPNQYRDALNTEGILNLGAWLVDSDQLP